MIPLLHRIKHTLYYVQPEFVKDAWSRSSGTGGMELEAGIQQWQVIILLCKGKNVLRWKESQGMYVSVRVQVARTKRVKEEPNFVMSLNLARWRKGEIQQTFYRLLSMCQITNTSYTLPVTSTQQCFQVGSITNLISQMRNLKDRKVKELVQGSTAGK